MQKKTRSQGQGEDGDLGFLSHGKANPARANDQRDLPYEYNGGEFVLDYQFLSEGKLDSIGFLLFLVGKDKLYQEYGKLKKKVKQYDTIKQNVDTILRQAKQPEREKEAER